VAAEVGKVMDRMLRRLEAAERQGQVEVQQVRRTAGWRQARVNLPEQGAGCHKHVRRVGAAGFDLSRKSKTA
jgi:hypothetical protein